MQTAHSSRISMFSNVTTEVCAGASALVGGPSISVELTPSSLSPTVLLNTFDLTLSLS